MPQLMEIASQWVSLFSQYLPTGHAGGSTLYSRIFRKPKGLPAKVVELRIKALCQDVDVNFLVEAAALKIVRPFRLHRTCRWDDLLCSFILSAVSAKKNEEREFKKCDKVGARRRLEYSHLDEALQ